MSQPEEFMVVKIPPTISPERKSLVSLLRLAATSINMSIEVGLDEGILDEDECEGDFDTVAALNRWATRLEEGFEL